MKQPLFTRPFTLLLMGQLFSLIGNYTLKFALSMYVLERTGSAEIFGAILAVSVVPTILFSVGWGSGGSAGPPLVDGRVGCTLWGGGSWLQMVHDGEKRIGCCYGAADHPGASGGF